LGTVDFDQPPVLRVAAQRDHDLPADEWPRTVPAVEQLLREGLELAPGITFLVGWYDRTPNHPAPAWEELELVRHWRQYLDAPGRYLRHVLD